MPVKDNNFEYDKEKPRLDHSDDSAQEPKPSKKVRIEECRQ